MSMRCEGSETESDRHITQGQETIHLAVIVRSQVHAKKTNPDALEGVCHSSICVFVQIECLFK